MDEVLKQLGEILLGAIPTVLLLPLTVMSYRLILHKPLTRVLAERYGRTEGALQKARQDVAVAETRTAEYESKISEAKLAIFKMQEARRNKSLEAQAKALAQARSVLDDRVKEARVEIEKQVRSAQSGLQAQSENLAAEVIRRILKISSGAHPEGSAQ